MSHTTHADEGMRRSRSSLDESTVALQQASARAHEAKVARAAATSSTPAKRLRELMADEQVADEQRQIAQRDHERAVLLVEAASRDAVTAEEADRLVEMHTRGVQPIAALEMEIRALEREIQTRRQRQHALFATEVAPRMPPMTWSPPVGLTSIAPPNHYQSLAHLLATIR